MVEGCRQGDPASWEAFVTWFSAVSGRVLAGFPNLHPLEREEAAGEARLKLVAEIQAHRLKANYPGEVVNFARLIVKRQALDLLRARRARADRAAQIASAEVSPSTSAESRQRLECLERLLNHHWSAENRLIFLMKINDVPSTTIQTEAREQLGGSYRARHDRCSVSSPAPGGPPGLRVDGVSDGEEGIRRTRSEARDAREARVPDRRPTRRPRFQRHR
jgi:DNA-directed RNA polymerase specialized sigma24 family protein